VSSVGEGNWLSRRRMANEIQCILPYVTQCNTVHSKTLQLHERNNWLSNRMNYCLYYILIRHRVSFALPPSISSPDLISTLLLPLVVFDMLALPFGIPSLIISDLLTLNTVFKSNLKTHLFSGASISGP